jgi:hypothetical protein
VNRRSQARRRALSLTSTNSEFLTANHAKHRESGVVSGSRLETHGEEDRPISSFAIFA